MSSEDEDLLIHVSSRETAEALKQSNSISYIFEERLAQANKLVDQGNAHFKANESGQAHEMYLLASLHADFDLGQQWDMIPDHKSQIRKTKIRILLNIANNGLRMKSFDLVKRSCSLGLKLCRHENDTQSETVAKFLYRRGKALLEMESFEESLEDAKKAIEILPHDPAVREVYTLAHAGVKQDQASSIWKGKVNMFDETGAYPAVDLVLTNPDGSKVTVVTKADDSEGPAMSAEGREKEVSISDIICCRRRKPIKNA
jgi:tetratricopeptide (TPR) repeat protein